MEKEKAHALEMGKEKKKADKAKAKATRRRTLVASASQFLYWSVKGGLFLFLLGAVLGFAYFVSYFASSEVSYIPALRNFLSIGSLSLVMIGGSLVGITPFIAMAEVVLSKNDNGWKIAWLSMLLLFNIFGLAAYWFFGRKDLKQVET